MPSLFVALYLRLNKCRSTCMRTMSHCILEILVAQMVVTAASTTSVSPQLEPSMDRRCLVFRRAQAFSV